MNRLWHQYTQAAWEKKILVGAAVLSLLPILAAVGFRSTASTNVPAEPVAKRAQMDTYIPKGFVLVPIEAQNYEALDAILGPYGVVDLLQPATPENPHPHLVARNVRLLRAPQNPAHFAVLVQESEAPNMLKFGSLFTVIVKHPEASGTEFVRKATHRPIVYEGG